MLSLLAESDPETYLKLIQKDLLRSDQSTLKVLFGEVEGGVFGGFYQSGLLWSLETLAWNPALLTRVVLLLAELEAFPLPENMMNRPLNSLRAIFLAWLPQTAADIQARTAAVRAVAKDNSAVGWKLLLALLPESHSVGSNNPRPLWRDWIPNDFRDRPSNQDVGTQYLAYANLALEMAIKRTDRLDELLEHIAHLPLPVFTAILDYLNGPLVAAISERERLPLWERLVREARRHRRFADTNWALSPALVERIEKAAEAISPRSPEVRHQYLFNFKDHDFFTSDDYEADLKHLAVVREKALSEVLAKIGIQGLLSFASEIKEPYELGLTAGQLTDRGLDGLLLPDGLAASLEKIQRLTDGFVATRYWKFNVAWIERLPLGSWAPEQVGLFFSKLPFQAEVWEAADRVLGDRNEEYWKHINTFPRGTPEELLAGLEKLVEHERGASALHAVNNLIHQKRPPPAPLLLRALVASLNDIAKTQRVDTHELMTAVKQLQSDPAVDTEQLAELEWHLLPLFDRFHGNSPVALEKKLATSPEYFVEIITTCYRAKGSPREEGELDPKRQANVQSGHRLLHSWKSPPGVSTGVLDPAVLLAWVEAVRERCIALGRWEVAQIHIGHVLVYAPADPEGLWLHRGVAELLNDKAYEDMRRGFTMELFNSRGVHFSDGGKGERELAAKYRIKGEDLERAGFPWIAAALNELAEGYIREAEREERQVLPGE